MHNFFKILLSPLSFVEIIMLKFYKFAISPLLGKNCCFVPTCSIYMIRSIKTFGAIMGVYVGMKRLKKCNGKNYGGVDLEPLNILGDYKWVC